MNGYGLYVLIATIAAAGSLAIVPIYASSYSEEACPGCSKAIMAQQTELPVSVWADSTTYDHSSTIMLSGNVANLRGTTPITVTVYGPQNNLVTVRQVEVSDDKTFDTTFSTAGALFKQDGTYTIRVQYGPQEINNKVTVQLTGAAPPAGACAADELTVKGGSKTYCVAYDINGATVTKASVSSTTTSVVLMIDAQTDGNISLTIPRNVLDAKTNGKDISFIVLVDGQEADFEETDSDSSTRTLDVMFPEGASEIEIIGTFAVPEFGTMAAIILAVAIVSIIAVSARTRLSILSSRY